MSRIGNKAIALPSNVKASISENGIAFEGPKGKDLVPIFKGLVANIDNNKLQISVDDKANLTKEEMHKIRGLHGLVRSLSNNCAIGVSEGFKKNLEIRGVGYRAAQKGKDVQFQLGFSHEVIYKIPVGISIKINSPTDLEISGSSKQLVGQVAADIRGLKKPEPYKGKGIRYKDEVVKMKAGKVGKK